jgi:hypothetical protein
MSCKCMGSNIPLPGLSAMQSLFDVVARDGITPLDLRSSDAQRAQLDEATSV